MGKLVGVVVVLLVAILIASLAWRSLGPEPVEAVDGFSKLAVSLPLYELFDLGVTDIDQDGRLDLFTLNHSARQAVALNDGASGFEQAVDALSLGHDREHPAAEDNDATPDMSAPGLYIYRRKKVLYLQSVDLPEPASGSISLGWPLMIPSSEKADAEIRDQPAGDGGVRSTLNFTIRPGGRLALIGRQDILELPHRLTMTGSIDPAQVFIGVRHRPLSSLQATLVWRDRHTMAWSDINGDGEMDVFIGRGGVKAQLGRVPDPISDELLFQADGHFTDRIASSGLTKENCPARQSAWVDHDGNGLLDLYVSCGRAEIDDFPNLLFSQTSPFHFREVAGEAGVDFGGTSVFVWVDVDQDGDADMLSVEADTLLLYRNEAGRFEPAALRRDLPANVSQLVVADVDNDGDPDAVAASKTDSLLLRNEGGRLQVDTLNSIGLPSSTVSVSWVDVDNDGLLDFHAVPGGLFRQQPGGQFVSAGELRFGSQPGLTSEAVCNWFDIDNSGTRDPLCVINKFPVRALRIAKKLFDREADTRYWTSHAYLNESTENHWLQVELEGTPGNRQAIGASVRLAGNAGDQWQAVGSAEGSHYSQGHYRLYFGLGPQPDPVALEVEWPDGQTSSLADVAPDQRITLRYPDSMSP